jgi:hypothetical protein
VSQETRGRKEETIVISDSFNSSFANSASCFELQERESETERDRSGEVKRGQREAADHVPELILLIIRKEIENTFIAITSTVDGFALDAPSLDCTAKIICIDF